MNTIIITIIILVIIIIFITRQGESPKMERKTPVFNAYNVKLSLFLGVSYQLDICWVTVIVLERMVHNDVTWDLLMLSGFWKEVARTASRYDWFHFSFHLHGIKEKKNV